MAINTTALSNILTSIAAVPGSWNIFKNHLNSSNELIAVGILDDMSTDPAAAPSLMGSLTGIPGLPPQVLTWVNAAVKNPTGADFQSNISQAKAALVASGASSGVLGGIFG